MTVVGLLVTDVDAAVWSAELDRLHARIACRFARSEPRRRARQYLSGLVAGLDRTNGWTSAEHRPKATPGWTSTKVRDWRAWHAHITLSMAAHAWLVIARERPEKGEPEPATAC